MFRRFFLKEKKYQCVFIKKIHSVHCRSDDPAVAAFQGEACPELKFTKIIFLPFVPQIGMTIQEYIEIPSISPKDKSYSDGITFKEKIDSLSWGEGVFCCEAEEMYIGENDNFAAEILCLIKSGWIMMGRGAAADKARDAAQGFIKGWNSNIQELKSEELREREEEELRRIKEICKFQGFLAFD